MHHFLLLFEKLMSLLDVVISNYSCLLAQSREYFWWQCRFFTCDWSFKLFEQSTHPTPPEQVPAYLHRSESTICISYYFPWLILPGFYFPAPPDTQTYTHIHTHIHTDTHRHIQSYTHILSSLSLFSLWVSPSFQSLWVPLSHYEVLESCWSEKSACKSSLS